MSKSDPVDSLSTEQNMIAKMIIFIQHNNLNIQLENSNILELILKKYINDLDETAYSDNSKPKLPDNHGRLISSTFIILFEEAAFRFVTKKIYNPIMTSSNEDPYTYVVYFYIVKDVPINIIVHLLKDIIRHNLLYSICDEDFDNGITNGKFCKSIFQEPIKLNF